MPASRRYRRRTAFARIQVHPKRHIADVGEAVDHVADVLAQPTGLVDHDHRRPALLARGLGGDGQIAVDRNALETGEGEILAVQACEFADGAGNARGAGGRAWSVPWL